MSEYEKHWTDIAARMEQDHQLQSVRDETADRICGSERPIDVVNAVLDDVQRRFAHCILFRVQKGVATVWAHRGWDFPRERRASIAVSSVSGNPLELLVIHPSFRGATPMEQAYVPFFEQLGLTFPNEMILHPVEAAGRPVGFLYADTGEAGLLTTTAQEEASYAKRLSLGLTIVLFKQKVRALGDA